MQISSLTWDHYVQHKTKSNLSFFSWNWMFSVVVQNATPKRITVQPTWLLQVCVSELQAKVCAVNEHIASLEKTKVELKLNIQDKSRNILMDQQIHSMAPSRPPTGATINTGALSLRPVTGSTTSSSMSQRKTLSAFDVATTRSMWSFTTCWPQVAGIQDRTRTLWRWTAWLTKHHKVGHVGIFCLMCIVICNPRCTRHHTVLEVCICQYQLHQAKIVNR